LLVSQDADPGAIERLEQRVRAMTDQIDRLRELVTRAYENTPRATAQLLKARRGAAYAEAYSPEPLVTVRIGAHEPDEALYERALDSVQRQNYTNWETIVICDGRDEPTAERIGSLGDPRIRCVQRPRNGPYPDEARARWLVAGAHPFNEGFALARGSWIAPIDHDDEWTEDHLSVLLAAGRRTRAEVVYGVARAVVSDDGETYFGRWPPALGDFGFQAAIQNAALTDFLYDANAHLLNEPADWNVARRMLEAGVRFEFVEHVVTTYYVNEGGPGIDWWRERVNQRGPL
jgi:glycosyltransferase involved in cell wall biosynthesis